MALNTDSRHFLSTIITAELQAQLFGPHLLRKGIQLATASGTSPTATAAIPWQGSQQGLISPLFKLRDPSQQHPMIQGNEK